MMAASISVVLPAYNEVAALPATLAAVALTLHNYGTSFEILVVNDGSTDGTEALPWAAYAERFNTRLLSHPRRLGKGAALKTGFSAAVGDVIGFTDADLPVEVSAVREAAGLCLLNHGDAVVGVRQPSSRNGSNEAARLRRVVSRAARKSLESTLPLRVRDSQCPLKFFRAQGLRKILQSCQIAGYLTDAELLLLSRRDHLRVVELPVEWVDRRAAIDWKSLPRNLVEFLRDLVALRSQWSSAVNTGAKLDSVAEQNEIHHPQRQAGGKRPAPSASGG